MFKRKFIWENLEKEKGEINIYIRKRRIKIRRDKRKKREKLK